MHSSTDSQLNIKLIRDYLSPNSAHTFLVGAGISMNPPSNLPSAPQIVSTLLKYYASPEYFEELNSIEGLRYEVIVQLIQEVIDPDLEFLDYIDQIDTPNSIHFYLAAQILKGHSVITTNFDNLIECALKILDPENSKKIGLLITQEDFEQYNSMEENLKAKAILIKLHGGKRNTFTKKDTSSSLVTTIDALGQNRAEGEIFSLETYKKPIFHEQIRDHTLVVMGYSGSDDFDISPALLEKINYTTLIWVEHVQEDTVKITKIIPNSNNIPNNEQEKDFLQEITNQARIPVYRITANTSKFITTSLIEPDFVQNLNKLTFSMEDQQDQQKFEDFLQKIYWQDEYQRYQLGMRIFQIINQPNNALQCELKGFESEKEGEDAEFRALRKGHFANTIGVIYQGLGKIKEAIKYFEEALAYNEQTDNMGGKASLLNNIGLCFYSLGKINEGIKNYEQALAIHRNLGEDSECATVLRHLGQVYSDLGKYEKAMKNYEEALEIASNSGNLEDKSLALNDIATLYYNVENYEKALKLFSDAIQIDILIGNQLRIPPKLNNIAAMYEKLGNVKDAIEIYIKAKQLALQAGIVDSVTTANNNLALIFKNQGKFSKSLVLLEENLDYDKQTGIIENYLVHLNNLGILHSEMEFYDKAKDCFEEVLNLHKKIKQYGDINIAFINLANSYFKLQLNKEAINLLKEGIQFLNSVELPEKIPELEEILRDLLSSD